MSSTDREKYKIWSKLKKLLNEGSITLDDLSAIVPGVLHVNNRKNLSFEYMSPVGCKLIGYTINQLRNIGPGVLKKHQSAFTREIIHLKVLEELNNGSLEKVILFYQDWKIGDRLPFFFLTTTRILNNDQLLSISFFPEETTNITPRVNQIFRLNRVVKEYYTGYNQLTIREKEILSLLANHSTRQEIASKLFLSQATVKKHCENIYRKLGTHRRAELEKISKIQILSSF